MTTLDEVKGYTAYQLANLADAACPDSDDSAGASLVRGVRDSLVEVVKYRVSGGASLADAIRDTRDDNIYEVADGAPSVYTGQRWAEFADLAAWNEDVDELAGGGEDMTTLAGFALYMIAERLCGALLDELESESRR